MQNDTLKSISFTTDFTMTIGGRQRTSSAQISVINPATLDTIGYAPECSKEQLDLTVQAATEAFPAWSARPFEERQAMLIKIAEALESNIQPLSALLTAEQGKILGDSAMEISGAAYWFRETAKLTIPVTVNDDSPEHRSVTTHLPLGVVAAIAPWNYPIGLAAFKLSSALLAGNTVVLKPSPFTPLTTLKMGEMLQEVLPAGVLNVVSGNDSLGPWMSSHPGFAKISFTGSTATGRKVMAGAAATLKRLTLELGGNDAAIVLPDVDIEQTARCIFWAAFGNSGQICLAAKRIYVHAAIYEKFRDALVAYAKTIKMGNGSEPVTRLGPVQNKTQYDRVCSLIRDAQDKGYHFSLGGMPKEQKGYFVPITIIDNPPVDARIVREEQFGPVLPLIKFDNIEDAIGQANDTEYGLGASVWSANSEAAMAVGQRLEAGTVWVNEALSLSPLVTFGGYKQSGLGSEAGLEGLLAYTQPRTIAVRRDASTWFGLPKE